jgi:flagellar hook-associated protein 3 FlgL
MIIRSTLFSRLGYMSQKTGELTTNLNKVQKQIASGKRLTEMSDEPWSVAQIHQLREEKSVHGVFQDASNMATGLLAQSESTLQTVLNVIDRTRSLAVQMSNDTFGADDLTNAVEEIRNMKERVRNLANVSIDGRYLFSGTAYDTPPFDSTFAYNGSNTEMSMDVSNIATVEVGFDGSDVFQGAVDVFSAFDDFITGLQNDDDVLIRNAVGDFNSVFDKINNYVTRIGTEMNIAMDMNELSQTLELQIDQRLSNVEDVDIAKAMTNFTMMQNQYQINLQLTVKTQGMSLFAVM